MFGRIGIERTIAAFWGALFTAILVILIVVRRSLRHVCDHLSIFDVVAATADAEVLEPRLAAVLRAEISRARSHSRPDTLAEPPPSAM